MPRPLKRESCNTCRRRKIKCDGAEPVCGRCSKAGQYCDKSTRTPQFQEWTAPKSDARSLHKYQGFSPPDDPRRALDDPKLARLFDHYLAHVSSWYDLSDAALSFGTKVPVAALDEPLLFCAVVALSAMQMSKTGMASLRTTAEYYHGCCIRLLIGLGEGDELIASGVALAATCLLRSYEILDGDIDPNRHLRGAYSMASQQGLLSGNLQRDLLAAGFWNYLREDITFSLFQDCPLKMDLESIPLILEHETDQDYLNSISLILGKIINVAFDHREASYGLSMHMNMVQDWQSHRPRHLEPFSRQPEVPGTAQTLPLIWFLQPCHASTMQYYLVALIILGLQGPPDRIEGLLQLSPHPLETVTSKDYAFERWALDISGIAFTTKQSAVLVNSFGPIAYSAKFIRTEAPRQELKRQLLACKSTIGWPVQRLIDDLESAWRDA